MTQNEYLFNVMSNIPQFADWLEKYNNFYSEKTDLEILLWVTFLFLPIFIIPIWFNKRNSNKNKPPLSNDYQVIALAFFVLLDLVVYFNNIIDSNYTAKKLNSETISLSMLKSQPDIDMNKIPKWASDNLVEYGYLTYVDIYRGFLESERDRERLSEQFWQNNRRNQLEQMKNW